MERWPAVGLARVGRVWGVWDPHDLTEREARESRNLSWQRMAWPVSLATLVVGWAGFVVLARRRCPIALLVAPVSDDDPVGARKLREARAFGPERSRCS